MSNRFNCVSSYHLEQIPTSGFFIVGKFFYKINNKYVVEKIPVVGKIAQQKFESAKASGKISIPDNEPIIIDDIDHFCQDILEDCGILISHLEFNDIQYDCNNTDIDAYQDYAFAAEDFISCEEDDPYDDDKNKYD